MSPAMVVRPSAAAPAGRPDAVGQRGSVAIEFALIAMLMVLLLLAIAGYGALFVAQQRISYAAGEGARAVLQASLAGEARALSGCATAREAAGWLAVGCEPEVRTCAWDGTGDCVSITVTYDPAGWPLIAALRHLGPAGSEAWMPRRLAAQATVEVEAESVR